MTESVAVPRAPAEFNAGRFLAMDGYGIAEFMISSLIVLVLTAAAFDILIQTQRTAAYQMEVQGVLENSRMAIDLVQRVLQQAGNDPHLAGFPALIITSATEVRARSDLTGSAAPGDPDKGDPDGDTDDANEDVTIRYNALNRTLELIPAGGSAQPVAGNIAAFAMQYFDRMGNVTNVGDDVRRIRVTLAGASPYRDPRTGRIFAMQLNSDIYLSAKQ